MCHAIWSGISNALQTERVLFCLLRTVVETVQHKFNDNFFSVHKIESEHTAIDFQLKKLVVSTNLINGIECTKISMFKLKIGGKINGHFLL